MADYWVLVHTHGPTWDPSTPRREQKGWKEHADFMDALAEEGGALGEDPGQLDVGARPDAGLYRRFARARVRVAGHDELPAERPAVRAVDCTQRADQVAGRERPSRAVGRDVAERRHPLGV